jgi:hypothetical protein
MSKAKVRRKGTTGMGSRGGRLVAWPRGGAELALRRRPGRGPGRDKLLRLARPVGTYPDQDDHADNRGDRPEARVSNGSPVQR